MGAGGAVGAFQLEDGARQATIFSGRQQRTDRQKPLGEAGSVVAMATTVVVGDVDGSVLGSARGRELLKQHARDVRAKRRGQVAGRTIGGNHAADPVLGVQGLQQRNRLLAKPVNEALALRLHRHGHRHAELPQSHQRPRNGADHGCRQPCCGVPMQFGMMVGSGIVGCRPVVCGNALAQTVEPLQMSGCRSAEPASKFVCPGMVQGRRLPTPRNQKAATDQLDNEFFRAGDAATRRERTDDLLEFGAARCGVEYRLYGWRQLQRHIVGVAGRSIGGKEPDLTAGPERAGLGSHSSLLITLRDRSAS